MRDTDPVVPVTCYDAESRVMMQMPVSCGRFQVAADPMLVTSAAT